MCAGWQSVTSHCCCGGACDAQRAQRVAGWGGAGDPPPSAPGEVDSSACSCTRGITSRWPLWDLGGTSTWADALRRALRKPLCMRERRAHLPQRKVHQRLQRLGGLIRPPCVRRQPGLNRRRLLRQVQLRVAGPGRRQVAEHVHARAAAAAVDVHGVPPGGGCLRSTVVHRRVPSCRALWGTAARCGDVRAWRPGWGGVRMRAAVPPFLSLGLSAPLLLDSGDPPRTSTPQIATWGAPRSHTPARSPLCCGPPEASKQASSHAPAAARLSAARHRAPCRPQCRASPAAAGRPAPPPPAAPCRSPCGAVPARARTCAGAGVTLVASLTTTHHSRTHSPAPGLLLLERNPRGGRGGPGGTKAARRRVAHANPRLWE